MDPIKDSSNWYVLCGNDPVNRIDFWGLEDEDPRLTSSKKADNPTQQSALSTPKKTKTNVYARYNRKQENMQVTKIEMTSGGSVDYNSIQTRNYHMTNNVNTNKADKTTQGLDYTRQEYPSGKFNMTSTSSPSADKSGRYTEEQKEYLGTRSIQTNAKQIVETTNKYPNYHTNKAPDYSTVTTLDGGYSIHGGGTSGDTLGNNNENDFTAGCIRGKNSDVEELANWVDEANRTGGDALLVIGCGE